MPRGKRKRHNSIIIEYQSGGIVDRARLVYLNSGQLIVALGYLSNARFQTAFLEEIDLAEHPELAWVYDPVKREWDQDEVNALVGNINDIFGVYAHAT